MKYFLEKSFRFFLICRRKIIPSSSKLPYLFQKDYILKNRNGTWKIKAKSDYDFTINSYTEQELEPIFQMKDGIFLDIGAHIGKWSVFVANQGDGRMVYAFEPNPVSYKYLQENIHLNKLDKQVISIQMGLGDKEGLLNFSADEELTSISHFSKDGKIKVKVIDLESFIKEKKISIQNIRLIKIDTEGFEEQVFNGMKNILKQLQDITLICELLPSQQGFQSIMNQLKDAGFQSRRIEHTHNYVFTK